MPEHTLPQSAVEPSHRSELLIFRKSPQSFPSVTDPLISTPILVRIVVYSYVHIKSTMKTRTYRHPRLGSLVRSQSASLPVDSDHSSALSSGTKAKDLGGPGPLHSTMEVQRRRECIYVPHPCPDACACVCHTPRDTLPPPPPLSCLSQGVSAIVGPGIPSGDRTHRF